MGRDHDPVAGKWYLDLESDENFQVLSVDPDSEIIEIQHLDGDVEEVDMDSWAEMDLDPSEEPEGWSASSDDDDDLDEDELDDEDDDDWDEDDEDDEDDDFDDDEDDDY